MEYTVQRLANLAGISTRTLRYYDEIGILKPAESTQRDIRYMVPKRLIGCSRFSFIGNWV